MATYYKYKDRSAENEINWAKIGSDFSAKLNKEAKRRETIKDEIDKETEELKAKISDTPSGMSDDISTFASKMSESTQNTLLMLDRSFKSGQLNYKDFVKARGNIERGVDSALKVINEWNAVYSGAIENMDKMGAVDKFAVEQAEKYGKFSDVDFVFDDSDYSMKMVLRGKDGKVKDYTSPMNVAKRLSVMHGKFDVLSSMKEATSKLSPYVTEKDINSNETLRKSRDSYIQSVLSSPSNAAEVLMSFAGVDQSGNQYEFTTDKSEAGGNKIYMENFEPKLTDHQMTEAKKILESAYNSTLYKEKPEKKTTTATTKKETQWEAKQKRRINHEAGLLDKISTVIASSDANEISSALNYLMSSSRAQGITNIRKEEDGIFVVKKEGKYLNEYHIPFGDVDQAIEQLSSILGIEYFKEAYNQKEIETPEAFSNVTGESSVKIINPEDEADDVTKFDANFVLDNGDAVSMSDYFDRNIDLVYRGLGFNWSGSMKKADNLRELSTTILNNQTLPGEFVKNVNVKIVNGNFPNSIRNAVSVSVPDVLDSEIILPVQGINESSLKSVLAKIHDAMAYKEATTFDDIISGIPDVDANLMREYNKKSQQQKEEETPKPEETQKITYDDDTEMILKDRYGKTSKLTVRQVKQIYGKNSQTIIDKYFNK